MTSHNSIIDILQVSAYKDADTYKMVGLAKIKTAKL